MRQLPALFLLTAFVAARQPEPGHVVVDELRSDFLRLEADLWDLVLAYSDNLLTTPKEHPERDLIERFERFGDRVQDTMPQDITHGLASLESLWVWARTYSELRGVYALYEGFRRFQAQQTRPGRVASPRQAWLDLTNAVLNDPKNVVNDSIARVYDLVNRERLFEEARKVKTEGLCD